MEKLLQKKNEQLTDSLPKISKGELCVIEIESQLAVVKRLDKKKLEATEVKLDQSAVYNIVIVLKYVKNNENIRYCSPFVL